MNGTTFYPQAALEGFGNALALKLGIQVEYTTGAPRTDGKTVYLPQITHAIASTEFTALCGIAVHEAAHVFFATCPRAARYAGKGKPAEVELRATCFNAVVDVADETCIERFVPSARGLLAQSNLDAANRILATKGLSKGDIVWRVLAAAILLNRLHDQKVFSAVLHAARRTKDFSLVVRAFRVLRSCKTRRTVATPSRHQRTERQWSKLESAADSLVQLLNALGTTTKRSSNFGPIGSRADTLAGSSAAGTTSHSSADEQVGADLLNSDVPIPGIDRRADITMNRMLYANLRPALAGPIGRLARHHEADGLAAGYSSGSRLGRNIERSLIDGRCFDRRVGEGEHLHVAILLDTSASMDDALADVSAVAQAFADAVAGVARSVSLAAFASRVVPVRSFDDVGALPNGRTRTEDALAWASKALFSQPGRKICLVITDGMPDRHDVTARECSSLTSRGVAVIAIAYGISGEKIARTMPSACVIAAADPSELSLKLSRLAGDFARAAAGSLTQSVFNVVGATV